MTISMRISIVQILALMAVTLLSTNALAMRDTGWRSPLSVPGASTVNVDEAKWLYDDGAVFIDVRNPRLFARRHIPGSVHLDLKYMFSRESLAAVADKAQTVVIYSSSVRCGRGARAAALAVQWGYTDVNYFRGGIVDWRDVHYPLQSLER